MRLPRPVGAGNKVYTLGRDRCQSTDDAPHCGPSTSSWDVAPDFFCIQLRVIEVHSNIDFAGITRQNRNKFMKHWLFHESYFTSNRQMRSCGKAAALTRSSRCEMSTTGTRGSSLAANLKKPTTLSLVNVASTGSISSMIMGGELGIYDCCWIHSIRSSGANTPIGFIGSSVSLVANSPSRSM